VLMQLVKVKAEPISSAPGLLVTTWADGAVLQRRGHFVSRGDALAVFGSGVAFQQRRG